VRGFLPELIDLIWKWRINPGKVFDLTLPLDRVAQAIARWTTVARSKHCSARNRKESENNR
jgi:threonine dehydrogenase-like Zn-dependent dehydrogenase